MERILIGELGDHVGEMVNLCGWVDVRRDQGKLVFFDFRDRSEYVVRVTGIVNKRPEKNAQTDKQNGDIELEIKGIEVLSKAHELPFDKDAELNIDTRFDNRPYTLRSQRDRDIFSVQASIVDAYRSSLIRQGFTDFQAPALVGSDAEGGSAVFKVEYFNDETAYLATSPQLYKQIMVGAFERVFTVARIFRAEKSATTRHLSEATCIDFEMGFINDENDVMRVLEATIGDVVTTVAEKHKDAFNRLGAEIPLLGNSFPILTL